MGGPLRYGVEAGVATLTLDTPHNRNALSAAMVAALRDRLAEAAVDAAVRVVVLAHTGGTFCAGADLAEARAGSMATGARALLELLAAVVELPTPVVARIAGHVRAGGMGLIGACDVAIASPRATFAFSEARLGLAPAVISATTRSRITDRAAGRYYLTGEVFDAAEAARIGLLSEAVAADDDLDAAVDAVTAALRAASPQGVRESKALTTAAIRRAIAQDGDALIDRSARLFGSAEAREGMAAFLERRPPFWANPS
jgi:enoyl-CoA hydratase